MMDSLVKTPNVSVGGSACWVGKQEQNPNFFNETLENREVKLILLLNAKVS